MSAPVLVCRVCGKRILTSKESFQQHTDVQAGAQWARHLPVGVCKAAA